MQAKSASLIYKAHCEICRRNQGSVVESLQLLLESQNYVLDIDIDFFSTQNPFLEMFSEEDTKTLTDLYHFTPPESNQVNDSSSSK